MKRPKTKKAGKKKSKKNEKMKRNYGFFGWREFSENRRNIVEIYFQSKRRNLNRPVRTQHGVSGESELRNWLAEFLPNKYGVTSGFIIPNLIVMDYNLRHFDIIIYDALESPVLWIDGDADDSIIGKRRGIPAEHVLAVFEVKATFTTAHIKQVISKLDELTSISKNLHRNFHSSAIFLELPENPPSKETLLSVFGLSAKYPSFRRALILSAQENNEISATVENNLYAPSPDDEIDTNPMCIDLDKIKFESTPGGVRLEGGCGVMAVAGPDLNQPERIVWHFTKQYVTSHIEDTLLTTVTWSRNEFARFWLDELAFLKGIYDQNGPQQFTFAQVFDIPSSD